MEPGSLGHTHNTFKPPPLPEDHGIVDLATGRSANLPATAPAGGLSVVTAPPTATAKFILQPPPSPAKSPAAAGFSVISAPRDSASGSGGNPLSPSPPSGMRRVSSLSNFLANKARIGERGQRSFSMASEHDEIRIRAVPHISDWMDVQMHPSPLITSEGAYGRAHKCHLELIDEGELVQTKIVFKEVPKGTPPGSYYYRAGPRREIAFYPPDTRACIVTCGGICPGLNTVIREIVMCLTRYGVTQIYGIQFGYQGFYNPGFKHVRLDPESVQRIHHEGGTTLGSSRGGMDKEAIINSIIDHGYNVVFIIGGDGTHRGAALIFEEVKKRGLAISVAGIPKTIDNDIPYIDKSFGFDTAVEEACRAIRSGLVEAKSYHNSIALIKVMGRHAGFIAVYSTLAARDVNICLIPEVRFRMDLLQRHIERLLVQQGRAVIIVAEGAGQDLVPPSNEVDASGNKKLVDIGVWMREQLAAHFKEIGMRVTIKYIDPTYMIRTIPPNAADSVYCTVLAHNAVHGAMFGFSGFSAGLVNDKAVFLPFADVTEGGACVDPNGRAWGRVLGSTGQPDFT
eukprot:tig00001331_g8174.t1